MPLSLSFQTAESDGHHFIYVFGGEGSGGSNSYSNKVFKYDTIQNQWNTLDLACAYSKVYSAKGKSSQLWVYEHDGKKIFSFDMETELCNLVFEDSQLQGQIQNKN